MTAGDLPHDRGAVVKAGANSQVRAGCRLDSRAVPHTHTQEDHSIQLLSP